MHICFFFQDFNLFLKNFLKILNSSILENTKHVLGTLRSAKQATESVPVGWGAGRLVLFLWPWMGRQPLPSKDVPAGAAPVLAYALRLRWIPRIH
jgi:hypothetical protein